MEKGYPLPGHEGEYNSQGKNPEFIVIILIVIIMVIKKPDKKSKNPDVS
jgi:hypothetical protein